MGELGAAPSTPPCCRELEASTRRPAAAASCRKPPPLSAGPPGPSQRRAELQRGPWEAATQGWGTPGKAVPLFPTPEFHFGLMQFQVGDFVYTENLIEEM